MLRVFLTVSIALGLSGCTSLLYYPTQGQYFDPEKIPLEYKDLFIKGKDGAKIHAWYFPAKGPSKGTFLFFHGNAENLTSHFVGLYWLPSQGYSYLIFDYPGYNLSDGSPTPLSTVDAGKSVLRWIGENKESGPLYVYGQSLGGNIALRVIQEMKGEVPVKAVIVDGSFLSYRDVGRSILAKHWLTWAIQPLSYVVLSDKYAPDFDQEGLQAPLLVIHGEKDPVVPVDQGKKIFFSAREPKQIWLLPDGGHGDSFFIEGGGYRQKLLDYLAHLN